MCHRYPLSLLLVILLCVCGGCGGNNSTAAEDRPETPGPRQSGPIKSGGLVTLAPDAPELKQMKIEPVKTTPVPVDQVTAPARIEANPNRVGHAVLPAPGRIVKLMVKLGDAVNQGDPLVAIESPAVAEAETAFAQAEVAIRQSEVSIAQAEADFSRLTDLFQHKAVAQKEVIAAQTALALAKASKEQALNTREQSRRRLELLDLKPGVQNQLISVRAPLAGKVLGVEVHSGEFRNEINAPLVTIADLSRVWATSEVPESEIRHCRIGGSAVLELIAFPGETFRAKVTRIADTVDSETRTIKVSAELENGGGRLRPEMFGSLRYDDGVAPVLWVPAGSVVRINDKDYVFVEQAQGRFQLTAVRLDRQHEGGFAVTSGLKAGDRVVTRGAIYLKAAL